MAFFRNSTLTAVAATSALVISVGSATFITLDAFNTRDTVLARALQSIGLCNPIDEAVSPSSPATSAPTSKPTSSTSATPDPSESESSSSEPSVSASPAEEAAAGRDGSDGSDGSDGQTGATGDSGKTGTAGATGNSGAIGTPGEKGEKGDTGATGANGVCDISQILPVNGDLNPSRDNVYSLGTPANRWKDLQLGPGTLWIQDSEVTPPTQVGLTVRSGSLLLDGADSLRIGNIRLTSTGLTSIIPTSPITLGDATFTNYVELQSGGLKFKDGSIQSTAATSGSNGSQGPAGSTGAAGATGPQGPAGATGATGPAGSIEGYVEVPVCIVEDSRVYEKFTMVYSKCGEIEARGKDIVMLERRQ